MRLRTWIRTSLPLLSLLAASCGDDGPSGPFQNTCIEVPADAALGNVRVPEGFCAWVFATGLNQPRGAAVAENGDLLVVERGAGAVVALFDSDGNGVSREGERVTLAQVNEGADNRLNHGIALADGFLYASTATQVFRWPYAQGARAPLEGRQTVVMGIPGGGHNTRSIAVDAEGRLYVSVGSAGNVDADSSRARIRRFSAEQVAAGNIPFDQGEVFADGLRNEVGLAFDALGMLWGVENGRDELEREDLGGDIHNDNPGEELNRFSEAGRFYGYPFCWSEFRLPKDEGRGAGTQWVDPLFKDDGVHTDDWCRDTANVVPPALVLPAHTAPLGLRFYSGGSFPEQMHGDAFVALHGSWNREPPQGYDVTRVVFEEGSPVRYESFMEYADDEDDAGAGWPHRPVDVVVGATGELLVTSDASGSVLAIGFQR